MRAQCPSCVRAALRSYACVHWSGTWVVTRLAGRYHVPLGFILLRGDAGAYVRQHLAACDGRWRGGGALAAEIVGGGRARRRCGCFVLAYRDARTPRRADVAAAAAPRRCPVPRRSARIRSGRSTSPARPCHAPLPGDVSTPKPTSASGRRSISRSRARKPGDGITSQVIFGRMTSVGGVQPATRRTNPILARPNGTVLHAFHRRAGGFAARESRCEPLGRRLAVGVVGAWDALRVGRYWPLLLFWPMSGP